MQENHLYNKLKNVYTLENLNKISSQIINAYRDKNYDYIKNLRRSITPTVRIIESKINKIFSKLIMLYHPDRLGYYKKEIEKCHKNDALEKLPQFLHIFQVLDYIDNIESGKSILFETQHESEAQYKYGFEDLNNDINPHAATIYNNYQPDPCRNEIYDFISALKHKEYGNLDIVYHEHDLNNIEGDLELSDYNISNLTGLEQCTNLVTLDLSNNNIFDVTNVGYLHLLEEIDLSFNQVSTIDALAGLNFLRSVDLSFNQIEDISPLFDLINLEYLNVIGNKIADNQIEIFREKGITIIF